MAEIAFVFPGQGAQVVGMGLDFFTMPAAKVVYNTFDQVVASDLSKVCFEGPDETLRRTLYTQPAILATSIAALALFKEQCDCTPSVVAGHSLGEYGALYAAGVIDMETAASLIKRRAELMEAAPKGAMSAVLGLDAEQVDQVVAEYRHTSQSVIAVANYNSENQVVISGEPAAVAEIADRLKEAGAKRVLSLPVGGAFHSPLMSPAASAFGAYLNDFDFTDANVPVVTNIDATLTTAGHALRNKLALQIDHSVRWTQTMNTMIQQVGVDTVIEFGPGKVLTGLFKKSHPQVRVMNVYDQASLANVIEELKASVAPV